jgi:hypothetical protein
MGKSSEAIINMREKEYTVNTVYKYEEEIQSVLFQVKGKDLNDVENYLNSKTKLLSYKTLQDTSELKKNDAHFRNLIKIEKDARVAKEKYINDKN